MRFLILRRLSGRLSLLVVTLVSLVGLLGMSVAVPSAKAAPQATLAGRLAVIDLSAYLRDFISKIPGAGTGAYRPPTPGQYARFKAGVRAAAEGRLMSASDLLRPLSYQVLHRRDEATGREIVLLDASRRSDGARLHAWGLYILRPAAPSALIVQVPHPVADAHTEVIGLDVFRRAAAAALFVAGAHRDANRDGAADVAHRSDSAFHAATQALVDPRERVMQVHGFAPRRGDNTEVVVSNGTATPSPDARKTADVLRHAGLRTCLYGGTHCVGELGATTNVQGAWTRLKGASFVHIEAVRALRDDLTRRGLLARKLAETLR